MFNVYDVFWCQLCTYFTHCFNVSITVTEQMSAGYIFAYRQEASEAHSEPSHLRCSFMRKQLTTFSLQHFRKKLHLRCLIGLSTPSHPASCSKLTIETLEQGVKYIKSSQYRHQNDGNGVILVSLLLTLNIFHTLF